MDIFKVNQLLKYFPRLLLLYLNGRYFCFTPNSVRWFRLMCTLSQQFEVGDYLPTVVTKKILKSFQLFPFIYIHIVPKNSIFILDEIFPDQHSSWIKKIVFRNMSNWEFKMVTYTNKPWLYVIPIYFIQHIFSFLQYFCLKLYNKPNKIWSRSFNFWDEVKPNTDFCEYSKSDNKKMSLL